MSAFGGKSETNPTGATGFAGFGTGASSGTSSKSSFAFGGGDKKTGTTETEGSSKKNPFDTTSSKTNTDALKKDAAPKHALGFGTGLSSSKKADESAPSSNVPPPKGRLSLGKVILIGDSGVGKTTFINKLMGREVSDDHKATVGADKYELVFNVISGAPKGSDGETVKEVSFEIMDTAGDEKYAGLSIGYYMQARGALFFYSTTNENSFKSLKAKWARDLGKACEGVYFSVVATVHGEGMEVAGAKDELCDAEGKAKRLGGSGHRPLRYFECKRNASASSLVAPFESLASELAQAPDLKLSYSSGTGTPSGVAKKDSTTDPFAFTGGAKKEKDKDDASNPFKTGPSFGAAISQSNAEGKKMKLTVTKEGTNEEGNHYVNFEQNDCFMYLNDSNTIYFCDKEDNKEFTLRNVSGARSLQFASAERVPKKGGDTYVIKFKSEDAAYFNKSDGSCRFVKKEDSHFSAKKKEDSGFSNAGNTAGFGQPPKKEASASGEHSKTTAADSKVGFGAPSGGSKSSFSPAPPANEKKAGVSSLIVKKESTGALVSSPSPSRVRDPAASPQETYAKAMKRRHQHNVKTLALLSDANTMRRNYDNLLLWDYFLQQREETLSSVEKMLQDAEDSLKLTQQKNHELLSDHPILNPGTPAQAAMDSETRTVWDSKGTEFCNVLQKHAGRLQQLEDRLKRLESA